MRTFDLVAVGGGAGGLAASRAAALQGLSVALISDSPLGGDCTWTGCVPSKTLIEAAARGSSFAEAMDKVRETVAHIAATEDAAVLAGEGVTVIEGRAKLVEGGGLDVDGEGIGADKIVLATGGTAMVPPIPGLRELDHLTNENLWDLRIAPDRLGILGGGPVGCELAQAMARLGVQVTVFEMAPRLLPREEPEAAAVVAAALAAEGVDIITGHAVSSVTENPSTGAPIVRAGDRQVEVDRILVALGRRPNTADMGLEAVGVDLDDRGFIVVDKHLATTVDRIWAVGDVNGLMPFTHAADEQGRIVGRRAGGAMAWRFDRRRVPWVTFTAPEVARVGVAEADAPRGARVAHLPMAENDRAIAAGQTDGFVKIIAGPRRVLRNLGGGRILGATIVGPRAGEMIHELALMMLTRSFTGRLAQQTHAYPTWSVGIQKCVGQFFQEVEGRTARPARRSR